MGCKKCNFIIFYLFSQVYENEEDSDDEDLIPDVNNSNDGETIEDEIDCIWDLLNCMEADLNYCSQLNPSERNTKVTETWQDIMQHFDLMGLEQTVGLILFHGSNYIEYVDCDIEGDLGRILRAENVEYLTEASSEEDIINVLMGYTQAEVLLQLKFEYELLARDEEEINDFHTKVQMITSLIIQVQQAIVNFTRIPFIQKGTENRKSEKI
ncbi:uncharacterized protein LOC113558247 [Rhopalosiphum maidis]|uniref:uncharacterized protein LOC113558247 n=1 Tax=Rhopalosiphum maidis TaxID=43146 RepID=UPI000EFE8FBC|nr:uncharacterized protein LOC113558247 [Rhopalosiphum maidis]